MELSALVISDITDNNPKHDQLHKTSAWAFLLKQIARDSQKLWNTAI